METEPDLSKVVDTYQRLMKEGHISRYLCTHPDISTAYTLIVCLSREEALAAECALNKHNIDCRRWYGTGVQDQTYFATLSRDQLDVTHYVLPQLIGLPVAPDLAEVEINRVVEALKVLVSS
jgi:dTDP-4-amino-4,6-dideoxygalactose transaminase